jgi:hypothetical protein
VIERFTTRTSKAAEQAFQLQLVFYAIFLLVAGPLALLVSWLLSRQRIRLAYLVLFAVLAALWAWFLILHIPQWAQSLQSALFLWWGGLVLAAPLGAVVLQGWNKMFDFLRPRDLHEHLEEQQRYLESKNEQLSRQSELYQGDLDSQPQYLNIGLFMKGDMFPDYLGIIRKGAGIYLNEQILSQHLLIIGTTGAGKSETLKRLIWETLQATDRDVFFIDGKGDVQLGREVAQLIFAARGEPVPIFKLGFDETGAVYHGFRGQPVDIYNRLCALVGVEDATGDAQYYADVNRDILQLLCHAPGGPPRSFEQVRERLSPDWLLDAYREDPIEYETIKGMDEQYWQSLAVRIRPLVREFAPVIGEEGFVLEESRGAVFSLRTQSVGDTSRRLLRFLVEDIKDFIGKRQERPALLIVDEFGVFNNQNIVSILTLARSANLGVVLATQDVVSLGEEQVRRLILANTRTKLLMATDFPEEVAELAGTIYQIEASIQHQDGEATGMGSARVQHAFRVDMNEAGRLQAGEAFLIRQRHAAKLRVKQIGNVVVEDEAVATFKKKAAAEPLRKEKDSGGAQRDFPELEL